MSSRFEGATSDKAQLIKPRTGLISAACTWTFAEFSNLELSQAAKEQVLPVVCSGPTRGLRLWPVQLTVAGLPFAVLQGRKGLRQEGLLFRTRFQAATSSPALVPAVVKAVATSGLAPTNRTLPGACMPPASLLRL